MKVVSLHDRSEVECFARRDTFLHLYELGDLDDFFWPHTVWYAHKDDGGQVRHLALLYLDQSIPTLLALSRDQSAMRAFLLALIPILPPRLYVHTGEEAVRAFEGCYDIRPRGPHHKMGLVDSSRVAGLDTSEVMTLSAADSDLLATLYRVSYPDNWFIPRMLETGVYQGIRRGGALISVAGVHVYSLKYKVAALGNVTTHPDWRGRGFATLATAKLCQELLRRGVDQIGLNVHADNQAAIACYRKLGFERIVDYGEFLLEPAPK
jgi:ribosomal protein S18 acetylase RimI-like enzyme